jgi:CheY-like chemotaxis protein
MSGQATAETSGASVLVLVVDDEPDTAALFRQQFRRDIRAGRFQIEFAADAPAGLDVITEARGGDIILVCSDINMPGMNGLELLERAKAARPDLPIIMITAYGDAETQRRAIAGGAEDLLPKPVDFARLRTEVDRCLARRAGRA